MFAAAPPQCSCSAPAVDGHGQLAVRERRLVAARHALLQPQPGGAAALEVAILKRPCTRLRAELCARHAGHARPCMEVSCLVLLGSWLPAVATVATRSQPSNPAHPHHISPPLPILSSPNLFPPSCPAPQRPPRGADSAGWPHPALPGSQLSSGAARQPGPPAGPAGPQVGSMMRCFAWVDRKPCIE